MKVIVICEDNSTFEFSSVFIYPYWDACADDGKQYQIRISHGTVFSHSKQDYAIYKCGSEKIRNAFHAALNQMFLDLHMAWRSDAVGIIKLKEIQGALS